MYNEFSKTPFIIPKTTNSKNPCEELNDLDKERLGIEDEFDVESATFMDSKPAGYKPRKPQDTSKCAP